MNANLTSLGIPNKIRKTTKCDPDVLDEFLLDRLPNPMLVQVWQHVESCSRCREEIETTRLLILALRAIGKQPFRKTDRCSRVDTIV